MKINTDLLTTAGAANTQNTVQKARDLAREKDLESACEGFEALMLSHLMKTMRQTLPGDTLFPDTNASDIYQSLHDQYLTENLTRDRQVTGFKEFLFAALKDDI